MEQIGKKRLFIGYSVAIVLIAICISMPCFIVKNLGSILSWFFSSQASGLDFVLIFSQTANASLLPHILFPLFIGLGYCYLLFKFFPKGNKKALKIALWSILGIVCFVFCFFVSLAFIRVNGVKFLDLILKLLPIL